MICASAAAAEGSGEALEAGDEVVELAEDGFVAGTPVSVAGGKTEPIEAVKKDERLESRDPSNLKSEAEPIQQSTVRTVYRVVSLTLADNQGQTETITATGEHPFWVEGRGFVPAGALRTGEHLTSRTGEPVTVQSTTWHFSKSGYIVYNFIVRRTHTYFVGRLGGVDSEWAMQHGHRRGRIRRAKDRRQKIVDNGWASLSAPT